MAGIYIHIPFCKQACNYCNFYFSTSLNHKNEVFSAILQELKERKNYIEGQKVESIYLGGGTPSLLSGDELQKLFDLIYHLFDVSIDAEVSIEANPDDINTKKLNEIKATPINRFSIGIQSFFDADLQYMNRAHNAQEALSSIYRTQDFGFDNISIDLIYGTPTLSELDWHYNLQKAIETNVPHISAYALTVEPQTKLNHLIRKKKLANTNDDITSKQFTAMINMLESNQFEQYEISNFCSQNKYSKHNSAYWKAIPYLGIGPSAHSFDGINRSYNVSSNMQYVREMNGNKKYNQVEELSKHDRLNERIMTGIRTCWGVDLKQIEADFGKEIVAEININLAANINKNWYLIENNILTLTKEGKLFADGIASDLFFEAREDGTLTSLF